MTGIELNPESGPSDLPVSLCSASKERDGRSRPSATFQRGEYTGKKGKVQSKLVLVWSQTIMVMSVP